MRSLIGTTSIARTSSARPGCAASLYRGWKQPANPPASANATTAARSLDHDIDDPQRHDDHLAGWPVVHRPDNPVEGKRRALDPLRVGFPLDRQLAPLLAVDLHDIGDAVREEQAAVGDRPRALGDESL